MTIIIGSVIFAALMVLVTRVPVALAMAKCEGGYNNKCPREQQTELHGFGRRALGAHANSYEAFPIFASGVILAIMLKAPIESIENLCLAFVAARCVYTVSFWMNIDLLRSTAWTVGVVASLWLMYLAVPV